MRVGAKKTRPSVPFVGEEVGKSEWDWDCVANYNFSSSKEPKRKEEGTQVGCFSTRSVSGVRREGRREEEPLSPIQELTKYLVLGSSHGFKLNFFRDDDGEHFPIPSSPSSSHRLGITEIIC